MCVIRFLRSADAALSASALTPRSWQRMADEMPRKSLRVVLHVELGPLNYTRVLYNALAAQQSADLRGQVDVERRALQRRLCVGRLCQHLRACASVLLFYQAAGGAASRGQLGRAVHGQDPGLRAMGVLVFILPGQQIDSQQGSFGPAPQATGDASRIGKMHVPSVGSI